MAGSPFLFMVGQLGLRSSTNVTMANQSAYITALTEFSKCLVFTELKKFMELVEFAELFDFT